MTSHTSPVSGSNPTWRLRGCSINTNGLNRPHLSLFRQLFKQFSFIALQETKFTSIKNQEKANYFIKSADPNALIFWSHQTYPTYTGNDGVGLLLLLCMLLECIIHEKAIVTMAVTNSDPVFACKMFLCQLCLDGFSRGLVCNEMNTI